MSTKAPSRVKELRTALQTKADLIEGMAASWVDETGKGEFVLSTKQNEDYKKAVNDAQEIRELLSTEEKAAGIFAYLDRAEGTPVAAQDAQQSATIGMQAKSLGESWLSGDAYRSMKESGFRNLTEAHTVNQGLPAVARAAVTAEVKDVYSAMGGNIEIPTLGTAQSLGWTERMLRPGRVRDLFPSERTTAAMLYGIRESGFTNGAATVPERTAADGGPATGGPSDISGLKPRSSLQIVPYTVPISTIAHLMYAHRNTLADEPRMRGIIDRDLIDGLKMVEDQQLLYGDGVGENITGLMNTQGIQGYTGLVTDKKSAQIRRAMTRALLAWFVPSGVVLHPLDWEDLELEVDANGAYTIATSVAVGGVKTVWRMKVIDTPAIQEGHFLLGAYGTGAKVYDREEVNLAVSTENRDLFERNAVTIRCEERLGLVVDRPESFVHGEFLTA